jgi:hypothetical protein
VGFSEASAQLGGERQQEVEAQAEEERSGDHAKPHSGESHVPEPRGQEEQRQERFARAQQAASQGIEGGQSERSQHRGHYPQHPRLRPLGPTQKIPEQEDRKRLQVDEEALAPGVAGIEHLEPSGRQRAQGVGAVVSFVNP